MSSLIPQSGPVKAGLLSLLAGVAYSVAAPMYAKATHLATGNMPETAFGIPAALFTIAGVAGLIVGTVILIIEVSNSRRY